MKGDQVKGVSEPREQKKCKINQAIMKDRSRGKYRPEQKFTLKFIYKIKYIPETTFMTHFRTAKNINIFKTKSQL